MTTLKEIDERIEKFEGLQIRYKTVSIGDYIDLLEEWRADKVATIEKIKELWEFYDSYSMANKAGVMINSNEVVEDINELLKQLGGEDKT